jgi:hypothetical protein
MCSLKEHREANNINEEIWKPIALEYSRKFTCSTTRVCPTTRILGNQPWHIVNNSKNHCTKNKNKKCLQHDICLLGWINHPKPKINEGVWGGGGGLRNGYQLNNKKKNTIMRVRIWLGRKRLWWGLVSTRVSFCGEFSPPSHQKKKGLANPTKGFLKVKFFLGHISRKKS